ncbi:hypothetical protein Bbelb_228510 [Branchiostoma belcheri]|nr:hypothetical protein Bbelb_228510 [Branchiostoma belcheri]
MVGLCPGAGGRITAQMKRALSTGAIRRAVETWVERRSLMSGETGGEEKGITPGSDNLLRPGTGITVQPPRVKLRFRTYLYTAGDGRMALVKLRLDSLRRVQPASSKPAATLDSRCAS